MKNRAYWMLVVLFLVASVTTLNYGCGGGGGGGSSGGSSAPAIAAPSNLVATTKYVAYMGYVVDLNWNDNSNNEIMFSIDKKETGSGWLEIDTTLGNENTYEDILVDSGKTYYYRVRAIKDDYITYSAYSNEVSITIP